MNELNINLIFSAILKQLNDHIDARVKEGVEAALAPLNEKLDRLYSPEDYDAALRANNATLTELKDRFDMLFDEAGGLTENHERSIVETVKDNANEIIEAFGEEDCGPLQAEGDIEEAVGEVLRKGSFSVEFSTRGW